MKKDNYIKKIITFLSFVLPLLCFSQVGINTTNPQATLDIQAKTSDGSNAEGLIVPRLTGDQIKAADNQYGTNQKGTLLYAISGVTVPSTKTTNITQEGYYFFDGSSWQKVATGNISSYSAGAGLTLSGTTFSVNDATSTVKGIVQLAGDLTGTATAPAVANNAITSVKIADGEVATVDIANNAVTSVKIDDGTIATVDIANRAITGAKINQMGALNEQVLKWNGSDWAPAYLPRIVTTAQMNAIVNPYEGMQVYNTNENCNFFFNGVSWRSSCTRHFLSDDAGPRRVESGEVIDLVQDINLVTPSPIRIFAKSDPMPWTNATSHIASGTMTLLVDGVVVDSSRFTNRNEDGTLTRTSSVVSWASNEIAAGNHVIILRISVSDLSNNINAERRKIVTTIN